MWQRHRLIADVEEDLIAVDLDNGALDDVAVIEVLDGLVDGGEDLLGRADVVDGDRGGAGHDLSFMTLYHFLWFR